VKSARSFIGGSDARIIMGNDEAALIKLWKEKRGEFEPEDLSGDLLVQLGMMTEHLNRHWYENNTGQIISEVQRRVFHPVHRWMAVTLDGRVEATGAVFEAKFMLPWNFSEGALAASSRSAHRQLRANAWAPIAIIFWSRRWMRPRWSSRFIARSRTPFATSSNRRCTWLREVERRRIAIIESIGKN
jgi:hypothetical protein